MGKKIGKDVIGKGAGVGIVRTAKDRAEFEEYKRKKAEDAVKEEKDEEREQELAGKKLASKMLDEREPRPEGLTPEEFAELKALAKAKKLKLSKVVLKEEEGR